jgi:hypothetical protein
MAHQRVSVTESHILPAIRAEAARLQTPERVELEKNDTQRRAELDKRRDRVIDLYEVGHIDRVDRERRLSAIQAEIETLDSRRMIQSIPEIDWSWPPKALNRVLRSVFADIQLDPATFQPIGFSWTVPEWREASGPRTEASS